MIVALMGGLANQMFQYAFGISVAAQRKEDVSFTDFRTKGDFWRPMGYGLDKLVTDIKIVSEDAEFPPFFTDDAHFNFQPEVYTTPKTTFLGYWQTEKYMNRELVLEKMYFRYLLSRESTQVAGDIIRAGRKSAFLHIRLGADYKRSGHHGLLTMNYYNEAVRRIKESVEGAKFFVFGDDHEWMQQNFSGPEFTIVNHIAPDTPLLHEDMQLMSFCRHGAIANSSFSWWGAWLGEQPNRLVFAPKRWLGETSVDTSDIVPDRWTKLEN